MNKDRLSQRKGLCEFFKWHQIVYSDGYWKAQSEGLADIWLKDHLSDRDIQKFGSRRAQYEKSSNLKHFRPLEIW